jgi:hypothetical protein
MENARKRKTENVTRNLFMTEPERDAYFLCV